jgi:hypothetical protein
VSNLFGLIFFLYVPAGLSIIVFYQDIEIFDVDSTVGINVAEQITFL